MTKKPAFKVGVSFHSFTSEYLTYVYSFEDLMEMTADLGGGVEIVGPSHHRGFPEVTDEFERAFKSSVDRYGLTPVCYGSYADPFMLPDRNLNPDELYEYTVLQLKGAAKLGFPIVRLQYFASVVADRLIPVAEKLDIRMGYELHTPLEIESSTSQELIAQLERISSDRLGLIPDCGIFGRSISQHHIGAGRRLGVTDELLAKGQDLWNRRLTYDQAAEAFGALGATMAGLQWLEMVWGSFGHSEPARLADIKPYIMHFHGKFFSIVDGDEPDLRYEEVVKALLELGYEGWMTTEYEGGPTDTFAVCKAHQDMVKRYIAQYA